jgi:hypothetical protein
MNIFGFVLQDYIMGIFTFFWSGLAFGIIFLGLIRFLLLSVFERREG